VDLARLSARQTANRPLLAKYLERSATGKFKWVRSDYPTEALAQDAELSLREFEDFYFGACHVTGDDDALAHWRAVSAEQQRMIDWLAGRDRLEVRGPNVDLTLSLQGRRFINADGHYNMPDGEIFTGPVEDSVNGWVRFTYPAIYQWREVEGVEIKFENGRAVQATARKNEAYLRSTLATDAGACFLGEFAISTNFGIQRFTRQILFDEKIGGTIHMAFGAGYPETGSRNKSAVHWDMICDMRADSEIRVDGELLYQNGQFKI
jgi:aminopeptidase